MTWGLDMNGGPHHRGMCPMCDKHNDTCTDGVCEDCAETLPRECQECGCSYEWSQVNEHGLCIYCAELEAEKMAVVNTLTAEQRAEIAGVDVLNFVNLK